MNGKNPATDAPIIPGNDGAPDKTSVAACDILGAPVRPVTVAQFIDWIISKASGAAAAEPVFVTYLNAACSNIAADDADYKSLLSQADCVYADGQAIVWAARYLGMELPERVNAGDFILEFCERAADSGLKIALAGGRPGVAERAANVWKNQTPGLEIAGAWNGFFDDGGQAVASAAASSGADILLVGMGAPLQEKWAWYLRNQFNVKVIWCVGALFEYYGEGRARAPVWVRRIGMEWLFRLILEPRRLWKRYLVGNVRFVWRVLRGRR